MRSSMPGMPLDKMFSVEITQVGDYSKLHRDFKHKCHALDDHSCFSMIQTFYL